MLLTNMCEGFIRSCYGEFGVWPFLGFFVSSLCFVHSWGNWLGQFPSCGVQGLGLVGVPFFGFVLWALAVLGITCLTSGKIMEQLIIQSPLFLG